MSFLEKIKKLGHHEEKKAGGQSHGTQPQHAFPGSSGNATSPTSRGLRPSTDEGDRSPGSRSPRASAVDASPRANTAGTSAVPASNYDGAGSSVGGGGGYVPPTIAAIRGDPVPPIPADHQPHHTTFAGEFFDPHISKQSNTASTNQPQVSATTQIFGAGQGQQLQDQQAGQSFGQGQVDGMTDNMAGKDLGSDRGIHDEANRTAGHQPSLAGASGTMHGDGVKDAVTGSGTTGLGMTGGNSGALPGMTYSTTGATSMPSSGSRAAAPQAQIVTTSEDPSHLRAGSTSSGVRRPSRGAEGHIHDAAKMKPSELQKHLGPPVNESPDRVRRHSMTIKDTYNLYGGGNK